MDMVIQRKKPFLAERITLLDGMDDEGLAALAGPLNISGAPVKVALVVLLGLNRNLFAPQIERTRPAVIEGFHRHL